MEADIFLIFANVNFGIPWLDKVINAINRWIRAKDTRESLVSLQPEIWGYKLQRKNKSLGFEPLLPVL
jgi:hypothetical protein